MLAQNSLENFLPTINLKTYENVSFKLLAPFKDLRNNHYTSKNHQIYVGFM